MIQENHQKRIVTNEDLLESISGFQVEVKKTTEDLYNHISEFKQEMKVKTEDLFDHISGFKAEMKVTTEDLYNSIQRLEGSVGDLRKSTLDGFDRVFQTIDEAKAELRTEFKKDILELRNEMNQGFSAVDKKFTMVDNRLSHIEGNMVYKHQLAPKFA